MRTFQGEPPLYQSRAGLQNSVSRGPPPISGSAHKRNRLVRYVRVRTKITLESIASHMLYCLN